MIVIPDIHGRTFWKDVVNKAKENEKIIFLGDYTDPYPEENITKEDTIYNLLEIIKLARDNKNVILLLGNHDCGYIWPEVCECRRDYINYNTISKIFKENLDLFKLYYKYNNCLFSHAGVKDEWLEITKIKLEDLDDLSNSMLEVWLSAFSYYRGGFLSFGSCVWSDLREWSDYDKELYQIFGHTQLNKDPLKCGYFDNKNYICLDFRKGYRFNEETNKIENL